MSADGLRLDLTLNSQHVAALEMLCGRAAIAFGHLEEALRDYRTQVMAVAQPNNVETDEGGENDGDGSRVVSRIVTDGVCVREG